MEAAAAFATDSGKLSSIWRLAAAAFVCVCAIVCLQREKYLNTHLGIENVYYFVDTPSKCPKIFLLHAMN